MVLYIFESLSTQLGEMHSARGCSYLVAPVLGNPSVAQVAKLTTFVAGDPTASERCNQLFNAYCQKIIDVGKEQAVANRLKLTANYILLVLIDLMGQVFTVGEKSNIDLQVMSQVMETIFSSPSLQEYAKRIYLLAASTVIPPTTILRLVSDLALSVGICTCTFSSPRGVFVITLSKACDFQSSVLIIYRKTINPHPPSALKS